MPAFGQHRRLVGSRSTPISGNSANLSLALTPGGCFCERFPKGGGIEHMRVTYVDPGKRVVLTGALGPLALRSDDGRDGRPGQAHRRRIAA